MNWKQLGVAMVYFEVMSSYLSRRAEEKIKNLSG
jgi:hypothetical protein